MTSSATAEPRKRLLAKTFGVRGRPPSRPLKVPMPFVGIACSDLSGSRNLMVKSVKHEPRKGENDNTRKNGKSRIATMLNRAMKKPAVQITKTRRQQDDGNPRKPGNPKCHARKPGCCENERKTHRCNERKHYRGRNQQPKPTHRIKLCRDNHGDDRADCTRNERPKPKSCEVRRHGDCCLTSRAQARGANQREPRSGTEGAIPRCLQRFVRPQHRHNSMLLSSSCRLPDNASNTLLVVF
jgi:hypothetical protein